MIVRLISWMIRNRTCRNRRRNSHHEQLDRSPRSHQPPASLVTRRTIRSGASPKSPPAQEIGSATPTIRSRILTVRETTRRAADGATVSCSRSRGGPLPGQRRAGKDDPDQLPSIADIASPPGRRESLDQDGAQRNSLEYLAFSGRLRRWPSGPSTRLRARLRGRQWRWVRRPRPVRRSSSLRCAPGRHRRPR